MTSRFASYTHNGRQYYGSVADGGMIALSPDILHWPTLRAAIAAEGLPVLANAAKGRSITHPFGSFHWGIPVPDPEKKCVGVNFPDRNAEYKDGTQARLTCRYSFVFHALLLVTRSP